MRLSRKSSDNSVKRYDFFKKWIISLPNQKWSLKISRILCNLRLISRTFHWKWAIKAGQFTDLLAWGQHRCRSSEPLGNGRRSVARGPPKRQDRRVSCWPTQFVEFDVLTDCWLRRRKSVCFVRFGPKKTRWTESQWEPLLMNWRPWRRFASVKSGNVPTCTWTERSARYSSPAPSSIWPVPSLQSFESVSIFQLDLGSPGTLVARAQLQIKLWTLDLAHFRLL
jgi:hypothetical protein